MYNPNIETLLIGVDIEYQELLERKKQAIIRMQEAFAEAFKADNFKFDIMDK